MWKITKKKTKQNEICYCLGKKFKTSGGGGSFPPLKALKKTLVTGNCLLQAKPWLQHRVCLSGRTQRSCIHCKNLCIVRWNECCMHGAGNEATGSCVLLNWQAWVVSRNMNSLIHHWNYTLFSRTNFVLRCSLVLKLTDFVVPMHGLTFPSLPESKGLGYHCWLDCATLLELQKHVYTFMCICLHQSMLSGVK